MDRKDCISDIIKRLGKSRKQVEDIVDQIDDRAQQYDHLSEGEAYSRARDEFIQEYSERAAIARRARIMDMRKEIQRHRDYKDNEEQIKKLDKGLATSAPRLALEAKLVGTNIPHFESRYSIAAQAKVMTETWVGGLGRDLTKAKLDNVFASRHLEEKWTDELFELNKRPSPAYQRAQAIGAAGVQDLHELEMRGEAGGNPGKTGDKHALEIAKIIQKWQKQATAALNREGAWVRSYSGYITRTSHDPTKIQKAGPMQWAADALPLLDLGRTFGTKDRTKALEALREMFSPMARGDHFDYGKPLDEPIYPNVAKSASASRELHFKDAAAWREYNKKYGTDNATNTVIDSLSRSANRFALMKELGTKPAEAIENDIAFKKSQLEGDIKSRISKLNARQESMANPGLDAEGKGRLGEEIASLEKEINEGIETSKDFEKFVGKDRYFGSPAHNRFAQIDGSAQRPWNSDAARLVSNWMAVQRMAKLGRILMTHISSIITKPVEARHWGIPFAERYASIFRGATQGAEGSLKRESLELMDVAFSDRIGHTLARYDVADSPSGIIGRMEHWFFKLTKAAAVLDNQSLEARSMFSAYLGSKRGIDYNNIGFKEQRILRLFGLGEPEWKALHGVDWTAVGDRTHLTPQDVMKLSDDQMRDYLKESRKGQVQAREPSKDDITRAREDFALKFATAYSDRAAYAIPMPDARTRAIMFQNAFAPGTPLNIALRLVYQFKIWPIDMLNRAWGREVYGKIGDGRLDRAAGLIEMMVGAAVFGVAGEAVREAIQGRDPIEKMKTHPVGMVAKGIERSGIGSMFGDFLLGEYDRHGFSGVGYLAGPTVSQLDRLLNVLHAGGRTKEGMFSQAANRERAADVAQMAHDNLPFMNLWATSQVTDALFWHRYQEWINPGYLQRHEQRMQQQQGTKFWLSPAKTDNWVTGKGYR